MDFGVHLPLADLGQGLLGGEDIRVYTAAASELGFETVSANDHVVWRRPWLDGLTSLASVVGSAGGMKLATSVALPAVRHPVVLAKAIASLGVLSGGPVIAGLGPGSSAADYAAVGLPFAERWGRFDESLRLVRALVRGEAADDGLYYRVGDLRWIRCPPYHPRCGSEAGGPT
jgi:alkanesulfonate monooxygenase SsuD/methylene tetrahydromethanopterin reductase-like flavin-dependent oxidoreductase (luciferase family)